MGYPTDLSATYRSRSVTGLSNVGSEFSEVMKRSVVQNEVNSLLNYYKDRPLSGLQYPPPSPMERYDLQAPTKLERYGDPARPGVPTRPLPAKTSRLPGALGRAFGPLNAAQMSIAAAWAARDLYDWAEAQRLGRHLSGSGEMTYPDPADYAEGSFSTECPDGGPNFGPWTSGLCGTVVDLPSDPVEQVDYYTGQHPAYPGQPPEEWPTVIDAIGYSMIKVINEFGVGYIAHRCRYYFFSDDFLPVGTDPTVPNEHWPDTSPEVWGSPGGERPPAAPAMADPLVQPVTEPSYARVPSPVPYELIPELPEEGDVPESSSRGNTLPGSEGVEPPFEPPVRWRRPPGERPPRQREKERKTSGKAGALIGYALVVTEVNDFVDAMWDALPRWNKSKDASINDKYRDLYRHWRTVDVEVGLENFVLNALEDAFIGFLSGLIQKGHLGPNPYWTQKWAGPEGDFEAAAAAFVEETFGDLVRSSIGDDVDRGTSGDVGDYLDRWGFR